MTITLVPRNEDDETKELIYRLRRSDEWPEWIETLEAIRNL